MAVTKNAFIICRIEKDLKLKIVKKAKEQGEKLSKFIRDILESAVQ